MLPAENRIKACVARHPEWTSRRISKSLNLPLATVESIMSGTPNAPLSGGMEPSGGNGSLIALDKVIARYDTKAAILKAVGELPKGKLISEAELCQRTAGTDRNRFRRAVENNPEVFDQLRIRLRLDDGKEGKWYWGKAPDIAEAQRIVNL